MYLLVSLVFSAAVVARKRLFCLLRRAEIAFGLVLYRVPCQCRALAWPFIVINRKLCSAELEKYFVR